MSKRIEIQVAEIKEIQHGVSQKNNMPWTLYNVIDDKGTRYGTFSDAYKDAVGKRIAIEVEERESTKINPKTGKPYINLNIVEPKKAPTGGWSASLVENLFTQLRRIEDKADKIIGILESVDIEEGGEVEPSDEINTSDIPF